MQAAELQVFCILLLLYICTHEKSRVSQNCLLFHCQQRAM